MSPPDSSLGSEVNGRRLRRRIQCSGLLFCLLAFVSSAVPAAEIAAKKMAILNTEQGKVTVFEDGVTIVDGGTRITAGKVEFYDSQNRAVIHGGVNIQTPGSQVTADSAEYLLGARKTYLYRNVTVSQQGLAITGQSLVLDNALDQVQAETEFRIVDAARGIEITGGAGTFDLASESGIIRSAPRLVLQRSNPMTVTGDEMQLRRAERFARTTGNVVAVTSDAKLTCDTLIYFIDEDSARATGRPKLKQTDNSVTGEQMSFRFDQGDLKRIDVAGKPRLQQPDGEITGDRVSIQFEKSKLAEIDVIGDSLHQPELKQERNQARGDRIAFHFQDGVVQGISMTGRTHGNYLTEDKDRVEVEGRDSSVQFRDGKPVLMIVADVTDGKLYHRAGAQK